MSDNPRNIGGYDAKKQVATALLDEQIADAQTKNESLGHIIPGSLVVRRTLPSSHDEVFSSSTSIKSTHDVRPVPKGDHRVDLSFDGTSKVTSGGNTFSGSPEGILQRIANEQSVKSSARGREGSLYRPSMEALMDLEERIAQKTRMNMEGNHTKVHFGPKEHIPSSGSVTVKNITGGESIWDRTQKKDINNSVAMVTGPTVDAEGIEIDSDLEDPAGKLAVAIAITEDDDDVFIPAAVQYDPDAKPPIIQNRRFRLYSLLVCAFMVVLVVGVAGLLTKKKKENERDEADSLSPEDASIPEDPTGRNTDGIIRQLERMVGSEVLSDVNGAHFLAKEWLLYQDPMQLNSTSANLIQRYLLAVVYFKLHEDGDWLSCNAPSEEEPDESCVFQSLVEVFPTKYREVPWYRWLTGRHECDWAALYCDDFLQLRSIGLTAQDIKGTLPAELVLFDYLQDIDLSWNKLRGTMPSEYGNMRHLLAMHLHYNQLTGSIPAGWSRFMSLLVINVAANMLSGSIPKDFFSMSSLKGLYIYENMLSGSFPSELGQMTELQYVRANQNRLTGTLPTEIGHLSPLEFLAHDNPLSGSVPSEIGNMRSLTNLVLGWTKLTGAIPEELWNLTSIKRLVMPNTGLSGRLSPSVSQLTDLTVLQLQNSSFTGTIPAALAYLPNLEILELEGNDFVGAVPYGFCVRDKVAYLTADCLDAKGTGIPRVTCACCHVCCDHDTGICEERE